MKKLTDALRKRFNGDEEKVAAEINFFEQCRDHLEVNVKLSDDNSDKIRVELLFRFSNGKRLCLDSAECYKEL